jgi:hypothetical protein
MIKGYTMKSQYRIYCNTFTDFEEWCGAPANYYILKITNKSMKIIFTICSLNTNMLKYEIIFILLPFLKYEIILLAFLNKFSSQFTDP